MGCCASKEDSSQNKNKASDIDTRDQCAISFDSGTNDLSSINPLSSPTSSAGGALKSPKTDNSSKKKVYIEEFRVALLSPNEETASMVQRAINSAEYNYVTKLQYFSAVENLFHFVRTEPITILLIETPHADEYQTDEVAVSIRRLAPLMPIGLILTSAKKEDMHSCLEVIQDVVEDEVDETKLRNLLHGLLLRTKNRFMRAPIPTEEEFRLNALRGLNVLDSDPEERYDEITKEACKHFTSQIALVSLVYDTRQFFKSCQGLPTRTTGRDEAFCPHIVSTKRPLVVPDAHKDPRFADNPFVAGPPNLRFYAGYPLTLKNGHCVGAFCVCDPKEKDFSDQDLQVLQEMTARVLTELERGAENVPKVEYN